MIAALVPAKTLGQAKGRLAALLTEDERRRLALAMLEDVLTTLSAVSRLGLIAVVSPDAEVLAVAREIGAEAIPEPASVRGINQALSHAAGAIASRGVDALLVVLGDVPRVTPGEIESVLDALPAERGVVVCPSEAKGTSALALRPPGVIPFRFGADSFTLHKRETAAQGIPATVLRIESLSHDIDEPDDLRRLLAQPGDTATDRLLTTMGLAVRIGVEA